MNTLRFKFLALVFVCAVAVLAAGYDRTRTPSLAVIDGGRNFTAGQAPDVRFTTLSEQSHSLRELSAPVVLLHFWASWCAPCLVEFPALLSMVERYEGQVALVAVSIDEDPAKMNRALDRLKETHGALMEQPFFYWTNDPEERISKDLFDVVRVPETIVLNVRRDMIAKFAGETDWSSEEVRAEIERALRPSL